jgi:hypothetical protein
MLLLGTLNVAGTAFHVSQQAAPIYPERPSHTSCFDLARMGQTVKRCSAETDETMSLLVSQPLRPSDFLLHSAPF